MIITIVQDQCGNASMAEAFFCPVQGLLALLRIVGWSVGWLVGWLDGWLVGWLFGWLVLLNKPLRKRAGMRDRF